MRAPEYVGYWVCLECGARVWASATLEDPLQHPPCPGCLSRKLVVDRRAHPRPQPDREEV
jgi:hypothetical protein